MTPADELRAAAERLRGLLANPELTAGPWLSLDHGDRLLRDQPGDEDRAPIYVVDEPMSNGANADYIAAMHPGVGAALADWLEAEAAGHEAVHGVADLTNHLIEIEIDHTRDGTVHIQHSTLPQALAVARLINATVHEEQP